MRTDQEIYTNDDEKDLQNLKRLLSQVIYLIFNSIPFQMIFDFAGVKSKNSNFFLVLLQIGRLSNITVIYDFIAIKVKNNIAMQNILKILFSFLILQHICGCVFVLIGKLDHNFNHTWFVKIPAPWHTTEEEREHMDVTPGTIYISALYWSFVTTSHVGVNFARPPEFSPPPPPG